MIEALPLQIGPPRRPSLPRQSRRQSKRNRPYLQSPRPPHSRTDFKLSLAYQKDVISDSLHAAKTSCDSETKDYQEAIKVFEDWLEEYRYDWIAEERGQWKFLKRETVVKVLPLIVDEISEQISQ